MKKLTLKALVILIAVLNCTAASGQQSSQNTIVPRSWKKINAEGFFTFYLPPNAWDTGFSGTDEYYREWRIGKMRFMFVHEPMGFLSYDMREKAFGKGFQEKVVEVAGRKAHLFDYVQDIRGRKRYYTDLYIGDLPNAQVKLWMQADSWRPADLEVARKIFLTVEFVQT